MHLQTITEMFLILKEIRDICRITLYTDIGIRFGDLEEYKNECY